MFFFLQAISVLIMLSISARARQVGRGVAAKSCRNQQKRGLKIDTFGTRTSSPGVVCSVFGASGFLGRAVVNKLCSVGVQMVVPFRGEPYNIKHLKVMGDIGQVVPKEFDMRDPDTIYEAVKHSNLVVNLVAQKSDTRNFTMESVNVDGARLLAKISREAGVERFIQVSTAGFNPHSVSEWIRTKSQGELAVREIFPASTIVRPTSMFGIDDQLLTRPAELIRYSPVFPMYKPDRLIQPVWMDDVARGILEIAANDDTAGKVYELAGPDVWSQRELYEYLFEILYHKPYVFENPDLLIEAYAKFAGAVHRQPRWTPEIIDQLSYNNVADPANLGFKDLGIETDELTTIRRYAVNCVRHFRRVDRYAGNVQDSWVHPPSFKTGSHAHRHLQKQAINK